MQYEETPIKKTTKLDKRVAYKALGPLSSTGIIWYLVKRHKTGLLATWAGIMTVLYMFPFVPDLVLVALQSL